jgi:hypothetical protein
MSIRLLLPALLIPFAALGCFHGRNSLKPEQCRSPVECVEEPTIRVKAPPQKVVVELPESCSPGTAEPKRSEPSAPENAPKPRTDRGTPESSQTGKPESVAGALALANTGLTLANQIAGFSRTTATTNPIGSVTPGSAGLGIGIRWIHIPIPFPHLFSVQESASITIPVSEANLVHAGQFQQVGHVRGGGAGGISREELSLLVEQELAARSRTAPRKETCAAGEDEEKKKLEKKLAVAEAQLDKMSKVLESLDNKLSSVPSGGTLPLPPVESK